MPITVNAITTTSHVHEAGTYVTSKDIKQWHVMCTSGTEQHTAEHSTWPSTTLTRDSAA